MVSVLHLIGGKGGASFLDQSQSEIKQKQSNLQLLTTLFKIALFSLCFSFQMFVLVLFWFQLYNGFSGSNAIDDLSLILFNLAFTTVPPVICGVLDKDVPDLILTANPSLYKTGQKSKVQISRIQFFFICSCNRTISRITKI